MTSTLGVWMLTGYGAAKAPRLMQLSVHCDHLRSDLYLESRSFTLRRNAGRFDHPDPEIDVLLNIRPRERARVRRFSIIILMLFCLTEKHGPFWAGVFRYTEKNMLFWPVLFIIFSASSTIRRNIGRFVNPFFRKRFVPLIYGHGAEENLTTFQKTEKQKTASAKAAEAVEKGLVTWYNVLIW